MAHGREGIRKAIVSAVTGLTTTGANVLNWSIHAWGESQLPGLAVEVASESMSETIGNEFGVTEVRDLVVVVAARATQAGGSSRSAMLDTVDDICQEVEAAIVADPTLGGLAIDAMLEGTEFRVDGSGEIPVAIAEMEWRVRYSVDRSNPT